MANTFSQVPTTEVQITGDLDVNVRDGAGNAITSTVDGPARGLDVQIIGGDVTIDNVELAVEIDAADGDNIAIKDVTGTNALDISAAGAAKVDGSAVTQPISAAALPLPAGASTSALQLPDGHNVTVDNAAGAAAVNIQDGGNSITVDGSVTADTELPAAAALADNTANPTAPAVGAFGMVWDGATWDRAPGTSADGVLVNLGANNDVIQATAANLNAQVVGNVAHDNADSDNPIKTGGKAIDMEPDTDAEQGPTDVTANDRVNKLFHLNGADVECPNTRWHAWSNISTTYDDNPTTATSDSIEVWKYRYATLSYELDRANTPTDIQFFVEVSLDGTNYTVLADGPLGSLIYDDVTIGAGGLNESISFSFGANTMRVRVVATGTTGSNTFTVANAQVFLRN